MNQTLPVKTLPLCGLCSAHRAVSSASQLAAGVAHYPGRPARRVQPCAACAGRLQLVWTLRFAIVADGKEG